MALTLSPSPGPTQADSGGAYAVYVLIGLAVLSKLGLLGYLILHRKATVFRDAQPIFCAITILGGVMGDIKAAANPNL